MSVDLNALIETISAGDQVKLLSLLARNAAGRLVEAGPGVSILPVVGYGEVKPEETTSISVCCQMLFRPRKLVILEQAVQHATKVADRIYEKQIRKTTTGMWWWKRIEETVVGQVVASETVRSEILDFIVPRSAWGIQDFWIGNSRQLQSAIGTVGGELFSPDNAIPIDCALVQPGLHITLSVRHSMQIAVPFLALLLGDTIESIKGKEAA